MANKRKGILTRSPQWWKHFRPVWKRIFWKKERLAAKIDIKKRIEEK